MRRFCRLGWCVSFFCPLVCVLPISPCEDRPACALVLFPCDFAAFYRDCLSPKLGCVPVHLRTACMQAMREPRIANATTTEVSCISSPAHLRETHPHNAAQQQAALARCGRRCRRHQGTYAGVPSTNAPVFLLPAAIFLPCVQSLLPGNCCVDSGAYCNAW